MKMIACFLLPLMLVLCSMRHSQIQTNEQLNTVTTDSSFYGMTMDDLIKEKRKTGYSVNHCSSESYGMTYEEMSYQRQFIRLKIILYSKTPLPASINISVQPILPDRNCYIKDPPKPQKTLVTTLGKYYKIVFDYRLSNPTTCEIGDAAGKVAIIELKDHGYPTDFKWFAFRNFSKSE